MSRGTTVILPAGQATSTDKQGSWRQVGINRAISSSNQSGAAAKRKQYNDLKRQNLQVNIGSRGVVKFNRAGGLFWKNFPGNCVPASSTFLGKRLAQPGQPGLLNKNDGRWLCRAPIAFQEQILGVREGDYRVFIDGVEVTAYVRGAISWTYETTGGMNTCRFTLNNNQDAFVVTELNICSNLSPHGWRIDSPSFLPRTAHSEPRYDELAKYLLYRAKYKRVNPGNKNAEIDPETGMWLYPLNPQDPIITKHDPVRVFRKLSHIDGAPIKDASGQKIRAYYDLWMPAFTGFVRSAPFEDDYVMGDRSLPIECFDYRGLMEGMRVRIAGIPLATTRTGQTKRKDFIDKTFEWARAGEDNAKRLALAAKAAAEKHQILQKLKRLHALRQQGNVLNCRLSDRSSNFNILSCVNNANSLAIAQTQALTAKARSLEIEYLKLSRKIRTLSGEIADLTVTNDTVKFEFKKPQTTNATKVTQSKTQRTATPRGTGGPPQQKTNLNAALSGQGIGGLQLQNLNAGAPSQGTQTQDKTSSAQGLQPGVVTYKPVISVDVQYTVSPSQGTQGAVSLAKPVAYNTTGEISLLEALRDYLLTSPTSRTNDNVGGEQTSSEIAALNATLVDKQVVAYVEGKLTNDTRGRLVGIGLLQSNHQPVNIEQGNKRSLGNKLQTVIAILNADLVTAKNNLTSVVNQLKTLIQDLNKALDQARQDLEKALRRNGINADEGVSRYSQIIRAYNEARRQGEKQLDPRVRTAGNLAELIVNEPTFNNRQAGLFADLIRAVDQNDHPLAGMSYEEAAVWLCCANSLVTPTTLLELDGYSRRGKTPMQEWNKTVLFGVPGRPLTYHEVTLAGRASTADFSSPLSPFKPLLHMLLPKNGSGARTIVQQDITANTGNSTSFQYVTRKSLLDEISDLINYQVFCNGWGDLVFEFPHYNAAPGDFGKIFEGAYVLEKEIVGANYHPESSDLYTAWVLTGLEPQKVAQNNKLVIQNQFYKVSIIAPILARRLGVRVEHIQLQIPGVGAQIGSTKQPAGGTESLIAYGMLHIQRQLGEAYKVSIRDFPDRPYLLPNRPVYIPARQKICLTRSVTYTMDKPNGEASCSIETGFTRWMFRDGTFRTVFGGKPVVDYAAIYTGAIQYRIREGVGNVGGRQNDSTRNATKNQRSLSPASCAPGLKQSYQRTNTYEGQAVGNQANQWNNLGGNTVGSLDASSLSPPVTIFGFGKYGAQLTRQAPNPGQKNAAFGDPRGTGLAVQGDKKNKPDTYQINNLFLNPYPFGEGFNRGNPHFNTWGVLRYNAKLGWDGIKTRRCSSSIRTSQSCQGDIEVPWHAGVDINIARGSPITTPIDLEAMDCYIDVGPGPTKYKNPTGYVPYQQFIPEFFNTSTNKLDGNTWKDIDPDALKFATDPRNLDTFSNADKNGTTIKYLKVYTTLYEIWKKSKQKAGSGRPYGIKRGSGNKGARLSGYGFVTIPNANANNGFEGKRLRCHIAFVHNEEVLGEKRGSSLAFYGVGVSRVSKGTTVAKVGSVGTNASVPHLHFEMQVFPHAVARSSDQAAFKEVIKANNEYLTTQLLIKFSGGNPQSNQLSDFWKEKFKAKRLGITNLREAVEYSLRNNKWLQGFIDPDLERLRQRGNGVYTNPFFFFKPEELVPTAKVYKDAETYASTYYSSQGFFDNIGQFADRGTPICGKIKEDDAKQVRTKFRKCVLQARKTATSNYVKTSRQLFVCRQNARMSNQAIAERSRQLRTKDSSQVNTKVKRKALDSMKREGRQRGA